MKTRLVYSDYNKDTGIYSHDIASACTLEERFGKSEWIEAVEKMNFYTFQQ